ncbi:MAG TPA: septation protein IspZ [Rhodopila sp.]
MTNLLKAAKLLLLDLASTFALVVVYLATNNMPLAAGCGMAVGIIQIGRQVVRKQPIDTMQYLSLVLVVASITASLLTGDPRFVMLKPSLIYIALGIVMLRPGWQNRYLPPIVQETIPDVAIIFGFVWAALMFASAVLNIVVALNFSVTTWSAFMSVYAIGSKLGLFLIQYTVMRSITTRRRRPPVALAGC